MKSDLETLKAWCQFKRKEPLMDTSYDLEMVKAIEDTISQVGTWKAKFEREEARVKELEWFAGQINQYVMPGEKDTPDAALTAFRKQAERIANLEALLDAEKSLATENVRLSEALKYYANTEIYERFSLPLPDGRWTCEAMQDGGDRAQTALDAGRTLHKKDDVPQQVTQGPVADARQVTTKEFVSSSNNLPAADIANTKYSPTKETIQSATCEHGAEWDAGCIPCYREWKPTKQDSFADRMIDRYMSHAGADVAPTTELLEPTNISSSTEQGAHDPVSVVQVPRPEMAAGVNGQEADQPAATQSITEIQEDRDAWEQQAVMHYQNTVRLCEALRETIKSCGADLCMYPDCHCHCEAKELLKIGQKCTNETYHTPASSSEKSFGEVGGVAGPTEEVEHRPHTAEVPGSIPGGPTISTCVTCGHPKFVHIYGMDPCRPGFICEKSCEQFISVNQPPGETL